MLRIVTTTIMSGRLLALSCYFQFALLLIGITSAGHGSYRAFPFILKSAELINEKRLLYNHHMKIGFKLFNTFTFSSEYM